MKGELWICDGIWPLCEGAWKGKSGLLDDRHVFTGEVPIPQAADVPEGAGSVAGF